MFQFTYTIFEIIYSYLMLLFLMLNSYYWSGANLTNICYHLGTVISSFSSLNFFGIQALCFR